MSFTTNECEYYQYIICLLSVSRKGKNVDFKFHLFYLYIDFEILIFLVFATECIIPLELEVKFLKCQFQHLINKIKNPRNACMDSNTFYDKFLLKYLLLSLPLNSSSLTSSLKIFDFKISQTKSPNSSFTGFLVGQLFNCTKNKLT